MNFHFELDQQGTKSMCVCVCVCVCVCNYVYEPIGFGFRWASTPPKTDHNNSKLTISIDRVT